MFHKNLPFNDCQIKVDAAAGKFSGYASTFGNVDAYNDTIVRGAYEKTLAENGLPMMFFNHDGFDLPIGKWLSASEDETGLYVEGELTMDSSKGRDVFAALKHGTLNGLSIGYRVDRDGYEIREDGIRALKEIDLVEVSVVTQPADSQARIDLNSVKFEAMQDIATERDLERFLREVVGCSKGFSTALLTRVKSVYMPGEPAEDEQKAREAQVISELLARLS